MKNTQRTKIWLDATKTMIAASMTFGLFTTPPTQADPITCGSVIGPDETVKLEAHVGPCDGGEAVLTVIGPASLDLNGHPVFCDDWNGDGELPDSIVIQGEGARVRNGWIQGCHNGVVVAGDGRHRVEQIESNDNEANGFYVTSDRNKLDQNMALFNIRNGVEVTGSRNSLTKNLSRANGVSEHHVYGQGYLIRGERNTLKKNDAFDNQATGFSLQGKRHTLVQNASTRNYYGYRVSGERHTLKKNTGSHNDKNGFEVISQPTRGKKIKLIQNVAEYNGQNGIRVNFTAEDITISRNTARNNDQLNKGWYYDLADVRSDCGTNRWSKNDYDTRSRACIE